MSNGGDADAQVALAKDESEERVETEEINNLPSASQITSEMMQNPQVLAALQHRLDSIVGTPSGYIESLPLPIKRRINALKNLQVESIKIEAKFYEEIHEIERKYNSLYQPLYEKRQTILTGKYEPNDVECEWHSESEDDDGENEKKDEESPKEEQLNDVKVNDGEDLKGIPEFWLTILKNVPLFQEMVQEHDEPILAKLQDIKVVFSPPNEPMGFKLEFVFDENPYFTNTVLTKSYRLQSQPDEKDPFGFEGPEIVSCSGCKIDWVKGKNVTVKTIKKKQKHKGRGTVRTVVKQVPNDSFFNFFNPPEVAEDEEIDSDTEALLTSDFEIGHMIRERIVPRAVLYFTGEVDDDDYDEDDDDDEDDEDVDDRLNNIGVSDDSEGANDSDYDPDKDPKAKGTPQECKQQ